MIIDLAGVRFRIIGIKNCALSGDCLRNLQRISSTSGSASQYTLTFLQSVDERTADRAFKWAGTTRYHESSNHLALAGEQTFLEIEWRTRQIFGHLGPGPADSDSALVQFMNSIISLVSIAAGGVPIHSSAICAGGAALVFCGQSGAGKSTIASLLSPPCKPLADDFAVISPDSDIYRVHTTPFAEGKISPALHAGLLLKGVYSLRKAVSSKIESIPFREQFSEIFVNSYSLPFARSISEKLLDNVGRLCQTIPMKRVWFAKNGPTDQLVEVLLN